MGRLSPPVNYFVRTLLKPFAGMSKPTPLLIETPLLPMSPLQVQKQHMTRGKSCLTPTEPVEENRQFVPVTALVSLPLPKSPPMPARVMLKPLATLMMRAPPFARASTRPLRTVSMLLPGQKMTTRARGMLVNLVTVVPLALFDAVAKTMTLPLELPPPVVMATKRGRSRKVMLPKVTAGLRKSLRQVPLVRQLIGVTLRALYRLLHVPLTYECSLLLAQLEKSRCRTPHVKLRHDRLPNLPRLRLTLGTDAGMHKLLLGSRFRRMVREVATARFPGLCAS